MKKSLLLPLLLFTQLLVSSQVVIDNTMTVQQFVQDVLLGPNITATNITFNGVPANQVSQQIGSFECIDCQLDIASGFVMSSGFASSLVGPNNMTGSDFITFDVGTDPDLNILADASGVNSQPMDWAIIEFDFVPLGDTLRFNYVWASEEYPDFVAEGGTIFNDFFGFFLSGPGINGPYSNNAVNIALIPGTDIPVGIGTLNNGTTNTGPCDFCEYYNQDYDGEGPFPAEDDVAFTDPFYANADGYTDMLTAIGIVQCGLTYHIKLAIADGWDTSLNSYVILERESFTSNLVVEVDLDFTAGGPNDDTVFEDCGMVDIIFSRPENSDPTDELIAYLDWTGTAVEGADYTMMPDSLVFTPGLLSIPVPFQATQDNIAEGQEVVTLMITNFAVCTGISLESEYTFFLQDTADPIEVQDEEYTICEGASQFLEPVISGGYGVYSYSWSTGQTTDTLSVSPSVSTTYILTVSDTCGLAPSTGNFVVNINDFDPLDITIPGGDVVLECGGFADIVANATGGDGAYEYFWFNEEGEDLWGFGNSLSYSSWNGPGEVNVEVTDGCGFTDTATVNVTINSPLINIVLPPTFTVGCNEPFSLNATVTGGTEPFFYNWSTNGTPNWEFWDQNYSNPGVNSPSEVQLEVNDNCGQQNSVVVEILLNSPPIISSLVDEVSGSCLDSFDFTPTATGGTGAFSYEWTNNGINIGNGPSLIGFTTEVSTTVSVSITDECSAESIETVAITLINPEITLETSPDLEVNCLDVSTLSATASNGTGGFEFTWMIDNVEIGTGATYDLQTGEDVEVVVNVTDLCGSLASESIFVTVPPVSVSLIASADTSICEGAAVTLQALASGGVGSLSYQWSPGASTTSEYTIDALSDNETVTVTAFDVCGNSFTEEINVFLLNLNADFVAEEIAPSNYLFEVLDAEDCVDCVFNWDFGDGTFGEGSSITHTFDGVDQYTVVLTVVSPQGCTGQNYTTVTSPPIVYIPNSFTPNNDGINDVWRVVGSSIREIEIYVFNRWGDVIFESTDVNTVWVGDAYNGMNTFIPDGTYPYLIKVRGFNQEAAEYSGNITLFR
jgi:gliding motility-associated-like protein